MEIKRISSKKKTIDAVATCAISLASGRRWIKSSSSPMIKGMMSTGIKNSAMDGFGLKLQQMHPMVKPRKIATPPRDGVIFL